MTSEKADTRRRYSTAMKAQVVAECAEPGASVAKIANGSAKRVTTWMLRFTVDFRQRKSDRTAAKSRSWG
ncbi:MULTISPECIES: transposase [unclassified Variovorax]|uniref:transposase n=1 Tax=unclassified Variovorax TaxID=663243 RepID=UPI00336532D7